MIRTASGPLDFGEQVHVAGFDIFYQKGSHITPHNSETDKTTLVRPCMVRADFLVLFGRICHEYHCAGLVMAAGSWNSQRLNRIMGLCGCILTGGCDWNSMTAVSTPTLDYSRIANLGAVELAIHRGNPG